MFLQDLDSILYIFTQEKVSSTLKLSECDPRVKASVQVGEDKTCKGGSCYSNRTVIIKLSSKLAVVMLSPCLC